MPTPPTDVMRTGSERAEFPRHSVTCRLERQRFEVRSFIAGLFGGDEALFDTGDEFGGAFADLVLLARCGELERNVMALPVQLKGGQARERD